jgi:hypothetical protein
MTSLIDGAGRGESRSASAGPAPRRRGLRGRGLRVSLAVTASGALAGALALAGTAAAGAASAPHSAVPATTPTTYTFQTLNNSNDLTFNQLLGINNSGVIAGYFGSGAVGQPNKGYYLLTGRTQLDYRVENYPGSTQTQVTGLNNNKTQVGFFSPTNTGTDANYGWYSTDDGRTFHEITVPSVTLGSPPVTQLLGVNNQNVAVGFYNDPIGNSHGFSYNIKKDTFSFTTITGATSVTDAGINNHGDITGFFTDSGGVVEGFLIHKGQMTTLTAPSASATTALGVSDNDEVVGTYTVGIGIAAVTHGFTWTQKGGFQTVNDPNGVNTTTVNGVNARGDLVGFYVDSSGNTDGMLAAPQH